MIIQAVFLGAIIYLFFKFLAKNRNGKSFPGPKRLPILGNLLDIGNAHPKFVHIAMHNLAKQYGDIMSIKYGVHDSIVLSSFQSMKDLLVRNEISARYDFFPFTPDRSFHQVLGVIFMSGDLWRDSRRYTMRNLRDLGFGKRASMEGFMTEELGEFIEVLSKTAKESNRILSIDPNVFAPSVVNILWYFVAGYRFALDDEKLMNMIEHNVAVVNAMNFKNIAVPFPILRTLFPSWTNYYPDMKAYTQLQDFMRELIGKARVDFKNRTVDQDLTKGDPQTFIEAYIMEIENVGPGKSNQETIFTEQHLIMLLNDLLLGGSETTSNTLAWSILYMVLYPEAQKKIQNEIAAVVPSGECISMLHLDKMPYTEAVMLEIFRIAAVVPMPLPRKTSADSEYEGCIIPKDTCVFFNVYAVLMDEEYWGDPKVFRPERFLDESRTEVVNKERMIMFGFGKRVCLGESLARNSFFVYFASLLRKFSFQVPPGQQNPTIEPQLYFTLKPQPFDVLVKERNLH